MNTICDIFNNAYKRKKYERQKKFKNRVNENFRSILKKQLLNANVNFKDYSVIILKHPLLDMNNNSVMCYKIKKNSNKFKFKYVELKIRLEE